MAMSALIGLLALALFFIFLVIGIVDLLRKKAAKRNLLISIISLFVFFAMMAIPSDNASDNKNTVDNADQAETKVSTDKKENNKPSSDRSGVTGIEPEKVSDPINNFIYEIDGNKVKIKEFQGTSKVAEIAPSYSIDGKTYQTELDDCFSGARTVIFDEGITTIPHAFFNMADVEKVYFPKSMTLVYDDTLAYMDVDEGKKYKIYYAGSQEEWNHIFQHYVAKDPSDLPIGGEKGEAIADKINRVIGHGYNSGDFEYFFNADPNDAR